MKQKLNAKDFILIGILTALMWIICMIISTIMSVAGPVTNVFYPSVVAIPNGIVMMLLLAKVPKKGVFTMQKRSTVYGSSGSAFTTTAWAPSRFQTHFLYRHPMCR